MRHSRYTDLMTTDIIDIRRARIEDAVAIASVREEAWRLAYQGLIPHSSLQKLIAAQGPEWWRNLIKLGAGISVLTYKGEVQGYVSYGRMRHGPPWTEGEIYELYLAPCYQGAGFGKRLFLAARKELVKNGLQGLAVWALRDNEYACEFYRGLGGIPAGAKPERFGKVALERVVFVWP